LYISYLFIFFIFYSLPVSRVIRVLLTTRSMHYFSEFSLFEQNNFNATLLHKQKNKMELQAKELRIVNWVSFDGEYFTSNIEVIKAIGVGDDYSSLFQPIPLTEQWLVKLGFVKDIYDDWVCKGVFGPFINGKFDLDRKGRTTPIKSVHQLQNLYFALTGEELEIKGS